MAVCVNVLLFWSRWRIYALLIWLFVLMSYYFGVYVLETPASATVNIVDTRATARTAIGFYIGIELDDGPY